MRTIFLVALSLRLMMYCIDYEWDQNDGERSTAGQQENYFRIGREFHRLWPGPRK